MTQFKCKLSSNIRQDFPNHFTSLWTETRKRRQSKFSACSGFGFECYPLSVPRGWPYSWGQGCNSKSPLSLRKSDTLVAWYETGTAKVLLDYWLEQNFSVYQTEVSMRFWVLWNNLWDIEFLLFSLQKDLQNLEDACDEMLMVDEDSLVPYPYT